jgi:hypothetical protein
LPALQLRQRRKATKSRWSRDMDGLPLDAVLQGGLEGLAGDQVHGTIQQALHKGFESHLASNAPEAHEAVAHGRMKLVPSSAARQKPGRLDKARFLVRIVGRMTIPPSE